MNKSVLVLTLFGALALSACDNKRDGRDGYNRRPGRNRRHRCYRQHRRNWQVRRRHHSDHHAACLRASEVEISHHFKESP